MTDEMRIGDVANTLEVTPATVRNWVKHYGDQLSASAIRATRKRFTPQDLAVLREVQRLLRDGLTYDQVTDQLPAVPEVIDFDADPQVESATFDTSALQPLEYMDRIMEMLDQQRQQFDREIEAKDETISSKDDQIADLKSDKSRLQAENEYLRLPFWLKPFRRPKD